MFGGCGADTFVFAAEDGLDTAGFEKGRDKIDLAHLQRLNPAWRFSLNSWTSILDKKPERAGELHFRINVNDRHQA